MYMNEKSLLILPYMDLTASCLYNVQENNEHSFDPFYIIFFKTVVQT